MAATVNGHSNGLYSYDNFTGGKKKSDGHFLWWCAGAHQTLLKDHPSEHTKYAGLGGVVLATFALASLSAGYALFSVFNNWIWAIGFGLLWGLIIFNFDRFLVSTMRKYGVSVSKQIWMTVPRIALALLIGITIARPLGLKIFEKEIDVKVLDNRHKRILLNDSLLQEENTRQLAAAEQERSLLTTRKLSLESTLQRLQQDYVHEADGTGGSMQRGVERLTLLKQKAYEQALAQYSPELIRLGLQISRQDSILNHSKEDMDLKRKQYESSLAANVGFLERNKALTDLSAQESSVFWANLFISLLIILIETGPIISKLIMPVGPYDLALAKSELLQMAASENDMRKEKELTFDKLGKLYGKKAALSDELLNKFADLQKKHIDEELGRWERGERASVSKSPMNELARKIKEEYDFNEEHVM
jgi:Domain of unknown function (DUF4407)